MYEDHLDVKVVTEKLGCWNFPQKFLVYVMK